METPNATVTPNGAVTVLIVDDIPANLRLLEGILKIEGFQTLTASSGEEALKIVATHSPDVTLLDIMMPGMDGLEVCRRIKSDTSTSWLPIVMVTALHETNDRVAALNCGADDFLTKPVTDVEVVARVRSLAKVKKQHEKLVNAYAELRRAESLRDGMTAMLVHDLRTPLTAILGPLEYLQAETSANFDSSQRELLSICTRSGHRLLSLINELLDISKLESGELPLERTHVTADQLVMEAAQQVALLLGPEVANFECHLRPGLPVLFVDDDLVVRILVNLIGNALKFTPSGGSVSVSVEPLVESTAEVPGGISIPAVAFTVTDTGYGIPQEFQDKIFDKFAQVEARKTGRKLSSGLGLTFCKLAVEAHSGAIWLKSEPGKGSTFTFAVPVEPGDNC